MQDSTTNMDWSGSVSSGNCYAYITVAARTYVLPLGDGTSYSHGYCCSKGYGWGVEQLDASTYAYFNRDPALA